MDALRIPVIVRRSIGFLCLLMLVFFASNQAGLMQLTKFGLDYCVTGFIGYLTGMLSMRMYILDTAKLAERMRRMMAQAPPEEPK